MVIKKISKIKILVFGSSGQLGSSLKKFYKKNNKLKFYFLSKKKLNINNYKKFLNYVKEIKPVYIINAAAYTNVDLAEQNKKLCFEVNSKSLKKIAK